MTIPLDLTNEEFSLGQVARMFLDQTTQWLRWKDRQGFLVDKKGEPIGFRRENRKPGPGDRRYMLDDVPKIADALHAKGEIDKEGYENILMRVEACRRPIFRRKSRTRPNRDGA